MVGRFNTRKSKLSNEGGLDGAWREIGALFCRLDAEGVE